MLEYTEKIFVEEWSKESFSAFVMGVDIGGTHTNIGIAGIQEKRPLLLFSHHYDSKVIESLIPCVLQTLDYARSHHDINVKVACVAAAGIVSPSHDAVQLTNASWQVSSRELIEKTGLESVYIMNDFQAIGYGINLLDVNDTKDIFQIRSGSLDRTSSHDTKAVIGAGTGLGKTILVYDEPFQVYFPIPTEGGHVDLPVYDEEEMALIEFIKRYRGIDLALPYEEVLSGRGLDALYAFVRERFHYPQTSYTRTIDDATDKAPLISKYKQMDESCKMTFSLFTRFYGRCAKNFVLDTLAGGGLYIAGGIAAKNKEIFISKEFLDEFDHSYRRFEFLSQVPLYVILNYDVSMLGSCYAAVHKILYR
jgi:glucokinase